MRQALALAALVTLVVLVALGAGLTVLTAQAQTVYVPHGGHLIAVPLAGAASVAAASAPLIGPTPMPADGGMLRVDGLPAGATVAVDGHPLGGPTELRGGWIVLPPGPHVVDVALPGGPVVRFTVVTPVETSGYQVVPPR